MRWLELRALTLWRPWDQAILHGGKRTENRPWKPWTSIIGRVIALHAGVTYDRDGAEWMEEAGLYVPPVQADSPQWIVGLVRVADFKTGEPSLFSQEEDPWFIGPIGWMLDDVVALPKPVEVKGARGLWRVADVSMVAVKAVRDQAMELGVEL